MAARLPASPSVPSRIIPEPRLLFISPCFFTTLRWGQTYHIATPTGQDYPHPPASLSEDAQLQPNRTIATSKTLFILPQIDASKDIFLFLWLKIITERNPLPHNPHDPWPKESPVRTCICIKEVIRATTPFSPDAWELPSVWSRGSEASVPSVHSHFLLTLVILPFCYTGTYKLGVMWISQNFPGLETTNDELTRVASDE